jgi:hypothetical protein
MSGGNPERPEKKMCGYQQDIIDDAKQALRPIAAASLNMTD